MSRAGGADGSAPRDRPAVLDVGIEIGALFAALTAVTLVAFRGRSLSGTVAPWRPFLPLALAVLLGLLVLRSRRPRAGPHSRAGLAPGRWLAGLGTPGLLLASVLFGVLLVLPPGPETLGADGGVYLEQLGGVLLGGRPFIHPGAEPGTAVLWAPFYLLGHGVALGARAARHRRGRERRERAVPERAPARRRRLRAPRRRLRPARGLAVRLAAPRLGLRRRLLARLSALPLHGGRAADGTRPRRSGQQPAAPPLAPRARGARARPAVGRARPRGWPSRDDPALRRVPAASGFPERHRARLDALEAGRFHRAPPDGAGGRGRGRGLRPRVAAPRPAGPRLAGPLSPEPGDHPLPDAVRLGEPPRRARPLLLERRPVRVDTARAAGGLRSRAAGPPRPSGRTHPPRHARARCLRARQHPELVGGRVVRGAALHRGLPHLRSRLVRHGRGPAAAPLGARPGRPRPLRRCRTSSSASRCSAVASTTETR